MLSVLPGISNKTKSVQSLEVLQLLIYIAAQTNAQQFIKMIFSTSAGKIVFDAYKNRSPLPEDVAMANGHRELGVYLQDITERYNTTKRELTTPCIVPFMTLIEVTISGIFINRIIAGDVFYLFFDR